MTDNTAAPPLTADPLWRRARTSFARALAAIGDLGAIAALKALSPQVRRRIIGWLAPLEHVVRKLLLAEATALHRADRESARCAGRVEIVPLRGMALHWRPQAKRLRPLPSQAAGRPSAPARTRKIDPAHPETWSAKFSLSPPRDPRAVPESRAPRIRAFWGETPPAPPPPAQARRAVSAEAAPFRLARRLEALRRVLENPLPHAERLARLLARAVRRFPEIVRRYLFAPARTNDYDKADPRLGVDAIREAHAAPYVITDSS